MVKSKNTIWWIIGIIIGGILFYQYSGFFSIASCKIPIYQYIDSSKTCYKMTNYNWKSSDGTEINSCNLQDVIDYWNKLNPIVLESLYTDSKCSYKLSWFMQTSYQGCVPNWKCKGWNSCARSKDGTQKRICTDSNNCNILTNKPEIWRSCKNPNLNNKMIEDIKETCVPNWGVGKWGKCINGFKTRTVKDSNNCGTSNEMPPSMIKCGSSTFSIFEIFSTLPNPFVTYPKNKDNLAIVFDLSAKNRPLVGGLKLVMPLKDGWWSSCTLGSIIKYQGRDSILTAAHCVQEDNVTLGPITYIQQGGETIGYTLISTEYNTSDSAIIYLNKGINTITKDAIGNEISGFGEAKKGMKVYKIGAKTGLTYGTVQDVNYVKDKNKRDKYGNYYWDFAIKGDNGNFSDHGDSGSAIITVSLPHKIVGIVSGGDNQTIPLTYSPMIQGVKGDLGIN